MNTDVYRKLKEGNQKKENLLSLLKVLVLLEIYPRFFFFRVCTFVGLDPDPCPAMRKENDLKREGESDFSLRRITGTDCLNKRLV